MLKLRAYLFNVLSISFVLSSPFLVLLALTFITEIPATYNLMGILSALIYALVSARQHQNTAIYVTLDSFTILKLRRYLFETGYESSFESEYLLCFEPSLQLPMLTGPVSITLNDEYAEIAGPKKYINTINKDFVTTQQYKGR